MTLTDAQRVDLLLDETKRLRDIAAYKLQEDGDNLAKLLAIRDAPLQEGMASLRAEIARLRQDLELSEATNAELRAGREALVRDAAASREVAARGVELLTEVRDQRDEALKKVATAKEEADYDGDLMRRLIADLAGMEKQRDEALARLAKLNRPSGTFTLDRAIGVGIGSLLVGFAAGAEIVWWPW